MHADSFRTCAYDDLPVEILAAAEIESDLLQRVAPKDFEVVAEKGERSSWFAYISNSSKRSMAVARRAVSKPTDSVVPASRNGANTSAAVSNARATASWQQTVIRDLPVVQGLTPGRRADS
eukprot:GHVU01117301.1.p4 GENE.GHVU01117301.1~~GHVU01117301.1.p4  ORF type:complete len:121 (+),score=16.56 GHVU01117301.1:2048-2410(+)